MQTYHWQLNCAPVAMYHFTDDELQEGISFCVSRYTFICYYTVRSNDLDDVIS
jgi:hypothetical protein